jgi:hypothetical protein
MQQWKREPTGIRGSTTFSMFSLNFYSEDGSNRIFLRDIGEPLSAGTLQSSL